MMRSKLLLLASALPMVAGCGAYLHRPQLEASTAAVKTSFEQLSAPAYLAQQQQHLQEFASLEDRAVAELNVASRDYSLINIVSSEHDRRRRAGLLRLQVRGRLLQATGAETLSDAQAVANQAFIRSSATRRVEIADSFLDPLRERYRNSGGTSDRLACTHILAGNTEPPADDPPAANTWYSNLARVCQEHSQASETLAGCSGGLGGRLAAACEELDQLRRRQQLSDEQKESFTAAVNALQVSINASDQRSSSIAEDFRHLVEQANHTPTTDDYREVLEALDSIFRTQLSQTLNQLAESRDRALAHPIFDSTYRVLQALDLIDDLNSESRSALDEPSALLIGLAKVQHELNLVEVEINSLGQQIALKEAEIDALRAQVHYLARVQADLCGRRENCAPSAHQLADGVSNYVSSFDRGLAPAEILRSRGLQVRRTAALRQAQATEADYRALLRPAIEQLAAYGAGGIRPEAVADFLANLPLSGAILGR